MIDQELKLSPITKRRLEALRKYPSPLIATDWLLKRLKSEITTLVGNAAKLSESYFCKQWQSPEYRFVYEMFGCYLKAYRQIQSKNYVGGLNFLKEVEQDFFYDTLEYVDMRLAYLMDTLKDDDEAWKELSRGLERAEKERGNEVDIPKLMEYYCRLSIETTILSGNAESLGFKVDEKSFEDFQYLTRGYSNENVEKRNLLKGSNTIFNLNPSNRCVEIFKLYRFINDHFLPVQFVYEWYALYDILCHEGIISCTVEDFCKQMNHREWFGHVSKNCTANEINT